MFGKTLSVPLFQDRAMQVTIVAAGFTPTRVPYISDVSQQGPMTFLGVIAPDGLIQSKENEVGRPARWFTSLRISS
ncbi:hypothetical protein GXW71_08465 [Roseomonas hellenica]|uniref:Uncharacterized protein n=1 Tax=Plastoroseomonas hellenica TaxID=2687306 RepID=A0ABS5EVQ3_9PROT|nr:hypothetical protein [Plastoroseomonas hellenica]MBR0664385.1 hypothetical protein [Plastoroseomonas hellenica]